MRPFRRPDLVVTALLAALFVRALVPVGFMPAQGELVELCSAHGPLMMRTDPVSGELLESGELQAEPPCPFALLLSVLAPSPTAAPLLVRRTVAAASWPAAQSAISRPSLTLPPARAPPPVLPS